MADRKAYQRNRRRKKRGNQRKWIVPVSIAAVIVIAGAGCFAVWKGFGVKAAPEEIVQDYFALVNEGKYEEMYGMLSNKSKEKISKKDFVTRNENIYEGIDASDVKVKQKGETEYKDGRKEAYVSYSTNMNTSADEISFENKMKLVKEEKAYRIDWDSTLIFPALKDEYKVQISTQPAVRGSILDRNGGLLAGQGTVSEVGIVPGKLGDKKAEAIQKIADILGMTADDIDQKLSASYVKEDSFVPVKEISKNQTEVEEKLLKIPGIMINDKEERVYPLGAAAGHLTGYVQAVTAEDLEKLKGKGYNENSVIGKSGLERAFEEELKAVDGHSIDIVDADGVKIENLALKPAEKGKDVKVTIDSLMQQKAYEQFASDPGTAAAMNPKTGEVLALVSTPGYDPNEFIMGMSDKRWKELNDDKNKPLTNRWYTTWVPGSTFKAVTAAIGVDSGKIKPDENMGYVGLKWQKDASWGDYFVTTLTDYGQEVNLENALVYSDNIYFARASLAIGEDIEKEYFKKMGFDEEIPFELGIVSSTYDDDDKIDSQIQLADTGYGQGQLLVNPIHMLSMYTMFVNAGNMIQPTILYQDAPQGKIWKEGVVSAETAELVKNDLVQVIENPSGTGAKAKIDGLYMLGKTGTAEIKESQDDTNGVERGWFVCETIEDVERPVVAAGMVEDVKEKGGSNYVTEKVREIVAAYEQ
ncbi:penicillin-binding transpeptidase domain-containing protein [Faecalicatena sp. AGMB00832]|uniref:Penicillin-binding transpeptidase domain-containing protein n=1 Tax=Faecalicatena faecalis TaxID=2726362 RepID=A0ABS6CZ59_9FIRM|nr:penicillin-binding transpeptidase domain-containing protein [Faecalicatena faecalis]MBU3874610.1 penicillin-binding transpeptidase domain-containing protein [Faecalicatena faecalis]